MQHALQDNIDEALIKIFYDRICSSNTVPCELHATIQCRLMLRVLRDNLANINQSTLDALNCLATYSAGEATTFPPLARPEDLRPSLELLLLVRGEGDSGGSLLGTHTGWVLQSFELELQLLVFGNHLPRHRAGPAKLALGAAAAGCWQPHLAQALHERPRQAQGLHVAAASSLSCLCWTRHLW